MSKETILVVLDDGSEIVVNVNNVAYVHFFPASVGAKPRAEIYFNGRERPLGVGEGVTARLRAALTA
jgi:hypothetical protein